MDAVGTATDRGTEVEAVVTASNGYSMVSEVFAEAVAAAP